MLFWVAAPFMDMIDGGFSALNASVSSWAPGALWTDFLANGVIASFSAFLVFVPHNFYSVLGHWNSGKHGLFGAGCDFD